MSKSIAVKFVGAAALAGSSQAYGQIMELTNLPANINGTSADTPLTREFYDVSTQVTTQDPGNGTVPAGSDFRFEFEQNSTGYVLSGVRALTPGDTAAAAPAGYGSLYDQNVAAGTKIGNDNPALSFHQGPVSTFATISYAPGTYYGFIPLNTPAYVAFQFTDAADVLHNGYLELETESYTSPSSPGGLIFLGGAYNSLSADLPDGEGDITAGAVPEPGTLSYLLMGAAALGAVGLARRRREISA